MKLRSVRVPSAVIVIFLLLLLSALAALHWSQRKPSGGALSLSADRPRIFENETTSSLPAGLETETTVSEVTASSQAADATDTAATMDSETPESDARDAAKPASQPGPRSTSGLTVAVDLASSYVYQDDLARTNEAYLTFWFNPNGADFPLDDDVPDGIARVASVEGPDGVLVALRVRGSEDASYKAYLEWSDENDALQFDSEYGQFEMVDGWQRITLGYLVDDWIAVWVNDELRRQIQVTHGDPYGVGIKLGKLNDVGDARLSGTLLYDDVVTRLPGVADLWVDAKTGDNSHNGQSPEQAFRTIQEAADVAGPGTTVHILPGVYRESIAPAMSGNADEPILYKAENGPGTATVRGSEPASSLTWTQLTGNDIGLPPGVDPANIYRADLSAWGLDGPPRFIVEMDGVGDIVSRLWPAREPDWHVADEWKVHEFWWFADGGSAVAGCDPTTNQDPDCDSPWRSFTQLTDSTNDADPVGIEPGNLTTLGNLTGATLVAMDAEHAHYVYRRTLIAHAVAEGRVTVDEECDNDGRPGMGWGSKYYVENHPALLDNPGEWWFDANSGYLYLWPPSGEDPATLNLEISRLDEGFDLTNRSYVSLDGLTVELFNGDAYRILHDDPWHKAHGDTLSNVTLRYADRGVLLYQYVGEEAPQLYAIDGFLLEGSEIAYMDTAGIYASFWWPNAPAPDQFSHSGVRNSVFRNNELHHLSYNSDHRSGIGVRVFFPDTLRFEGNYVHHVAQNGAHFHLSLADSAKEYDFSPEEIKLGEILVKDNIFERACQLSSDCGALKFGGNQRPYTHVFRDVLVTGNVFRDAFGWSYVSTKRGLNEVGDGNGIYVDRASGIHAYRNIAYNNTGAGFKLACLWRDGDIVFYNNIAANNYAQGFKLTGSGDSCDDHLGSVNTQLVNNILVNNDGHGMQLVSGYDNDVYGNLVIDHNLYYGNGWNDQAAWNPADIQLFKGSGPAQYLHGLAEIQSGSPWEDHGVEGDPAFIDYDIEDHDRYDGSWPDFHITAASVNALDRGTADLPGSLKRLLVTFGVEDAHLGSTFDLGRYEAAGALATPTMDAVQPGETTQFALSLYPPTYPDSLALAAYSPSSYLSIDLSSTVLSPGDTVVLTVTDLHDPGTVIEPGEIYVITLAATGDEGAQYTEIRLLVGGARVHLPAILRSSP